MDFYNNGPTAPTTANQSPKSKLENSHQARVLINLTVAFDLTSSYVPVVFCFTPLLKTIELDHQRTAKHTAQKMHCT